MSVRLTLEFFARHADPAEPAGGLSCGLARAVPLLLRIFGRRADSLYPAPSRRAAGARRPSGGEEGEAACRGPSWASAALPRERAPGEPAIGPRGGGPASPAGKISAGGSAGGLSCGLARAVALCIVFGALAAGSDSLAAPAPSPGPGEYRLTAGDKIEIRVFGQPELSMQLRVPPSGEIAFPGIDRLALINRAPGEVERELRDRLVRSGFLKDPIVTLFVLEFVPRSVYVLGRIHEPGIYEIPVGQVLLLSQAISMAKGFTEDADLAHVRILRAQGNFTRSEEVDFRLVESATDLSKNVFLAAGDQVIVPELKSAYVIGEVNRPGEIRLPADVKLTVSRVLSLAGGFSDRTADLSSVRIFRRSGQGFSSFEVDVKAWLEGEKTEPEPTVEPEDLIYVPRRSVL